MAVIKKIYPKMNNDDLVIKTTEIFIYYLIKE